jgi:hypothetical protein
MRASAAFSNAVGLKSSRRPVAVYRLSFSTKIEAVRPREAGYCWLKYFASPPAR